MHACDGVCLLRMTSMWMWGSTWRCHRQQRQRLPHSRDHEHDDDDHDDDGDATASDPHRRFVRSDTDRTSSDMHAVLQSTAEHDSAHERGARTNSVHCTAVRHTSH